MANISINTNPTGRSPDKKFFFGRQTKSLDLTRPKYNKIGKEKDYSDFLKFYTNFHAKLIYHRIATVLCFV